MSVYSGVTARDQMFRSKYDTFVSYQFPQFITDIDNYY